VTTLSPPVHSTYSYPANRAKRPQFGGDNRDALKDYRAYLTAKEEENKRILQQYRTQTRDKFKEEAKAKGFEHSDMIDAFADIKLKEKDAKDRVYRDSFAQSLFRSVKRQEGLERWLLGGMITSGLLEADIRAKNLVAQQSIRAQIDAVKAIENKRKADNDGDTFQPSQK
jgi:hypothetical protein